MDLENESIKLNFVADRTIIIIIAIDWLSVAVQQTTIVLLLYFRIILGCTNVLYRRGNIS